MTAPFASAHCLPVPTAAVLILYVWDCVPPPHDFEQADQEDQLPTQSTSGIGAAVVTRGAAVVARGGAVVDRGAAVVDRGDYD